MFDGRKYDSKLEATVAQESESSCKAGEVVRVEPQRTFVLFGKNGGTVCSHRVDFLLTFKDEHQEVWEAKGLATDERSSRRKLSLATKPTAKWRNAPRSF